MENQPVNWTIMAYINADNILANFAVESLKQLRNAASENVTVIAEFADNQPDKNQQRGARVYLFDGKKRDELLAASLLPPEDVRGLKHVQDIDMTQPETLTEFIDFATQKAPAEHYCLVLWGHGIELLLDDDRRFATTGKPDEAGSAPADPKPAEGSPEDDKQRARYLTIANLRNALRSTKLATLKSGTSFSKTTLDIIGFDACSMSMLEVASAIQKYADYMIASQEDVPDMSFPYEKILGKLGGVRGNVKEVCALVPQLYQDSYCDYIATPGTGVKGITLASLDLRKAGNVATPLKKLGTALLQASHFPEKRDAIFRARENAKDFVFGILADLDDFCQHLQKAFEDHTIKDINLLSACSEVRAALEQSQDGFVLENQVTRNDERCRGISVYFPYRNQHDATDNMDERLSKGSGIRPLKGTGNRPLKGTGNRPLKERAARIQELEADFSQLDENGVKEWIDFIQQGWSFILTNKEPFNLDYYYSAEQCAVNLVSRREDADAKAA